MCVWLGLFRSVLGQKSKICYMWLRPDEHLSLYEVDRDVQGSPRMLLPRQEQFVMKLFIVTINSTTYFLAFFSGTNRKIFERRERIFEHARAVLWSCRKGLKTNSKFIIIKKKKITNNLLTKVWLFFLSKTKHNRPHIRPAH